MRRVKKDKTVVIQETVYKASVDLTPAEAAILFSLLNKPAAATAKHITGDELWGTRLDKAHYDLWCKFFGYSDMDKIEATAILETY